jgi:hypothetical protein
MAAAGVTAVLFAFLPAILGGIMGRPPFGSNIPQAALFGVSFFCTVFYNNFMIMAAWAPCLWFYSELRIARCLLNLITSDHSMGCVWSTHRAALAQSHRNPLPELDLRQGANVVAWRALWRVLYGRSFCPSVNVKLQVVNREMDSDLTTDCRLITKVEITCEAHSAQPYSQHNLLS